MILRYNYNIIAISCRRGGVKRDKHSSMKSTSAWFKDFILVIYLISSLIKHNLPTLPIMKFLEILPLNANK